MKEQFPLRIRLQPGKPVRTYAAAGSTIIVTCGAVVVSAAESFLDGKALERQLTLQEGEAYTVARAGWLAFSSNPPTEAACIEHDMPENPLRAGMRTLFAAMLRQLTPVESATRKR